MKQFYVLVFTLAIILTSCSTPIQPQTIIKSNVKSQASEFPDITSSPGFETQSNVSEPSNTSEKSNTSTTTSSAKQTKQAPKPPKSTKPAPTSTPTPPPVVTDKMNAVWISYLEYNEGMLKGKTLDQFKANINKAFDNVKSIGVNTVIVHVRPFGDAVYNSGYYPWSSTVTGTLGKAPSFDPLKVMVDIAHQKGLAIHAWINPFRLMTETEIKTLPETSVIKKLYNNKDNTDDIKYINGRWYLNPASSEGQQLVINGISEIVKNYNVDGIHIDDYFYPTTDLSFDSYSYNQSGTHLSTTAWRQTNISKIVSNIYKTIKGIKPNVLFGISPDGSIENNYTQHYADIRLWASTPGYLDYLTPQVYYGFNHQSLPFEKATKDWASIVKLNNIKIIYGLANYKIGNVDNWAGTGKFEWIESTDIIPRQIQFVKTLPRYDGVAFFRYGSMFDQSGQLVGITQTQTLNIKDTLK